jgi:hypothetical protein
MWGNTLKASWKLEDASMGEEGEILDARFWIERAEIKEMGTPRHRLM